MSGFQFNFKRWPIVVVNAEGDLPPPLAEQHFRDYRALLDRELRYGLIFDASKVGNVPPQVRKLYAEFLNKNAADFERLCKGVGFVITSAAVRGMLTAVLWLTDLPFPYKIVGSSEEAEAWLRDQP